jgi:hypothetical protein
MFTPHFFALLIKEDAIHASHHANFFKTLKFFLRVTCAISRLVLVKGAARELDHKKTTNMTHLKKETKMTAINRREFFSLLGGATAMSMAIPAIASSTDNVAAALTSLYVKGLVMVDLGDPDILRLGFPKAPGHSATLAVLPQRWCETRDAHQGERRCRSQAGHVCGYKGPRS